MVDGVELNDVDGFGDAVDDELGWSFLIFYLYHLILHLELLFRALRCGGLPSSLSGSAPAIIWTWCGLWQGNSLGV